MYSIHGTIDIIVDEKTNKQCDNEYNKVVRKIKKLVTQLDINETYKTVETKDEF